MIHNERKIKIYNYLALSIAAGICIGIATITNLLIANKYIGALLFCIGLFFICSYRLKLCTGIAGYLFNKQYNEHLVIAIVGNIIGIFITYILAYLWNPDIKYLSYAILENKIYLIPLYKTFISAIFCGILVFLAVDGYKSRADIISKLLSIFLCVYCFVINGFDHCIVTFFYTLSSNSFAEFIQALQLFSVVMIGNFLGAISAWLLFKYFNVEE